MAVNHRSTPTNLMNKKVLVVGLGRTGIALARFLVKQRAKVTVTDQNHEALLGDYPAQCRRMGVALQLGEHREETFTTADLVVISPGVPLSIPPVQAAKAAGVPVTGEMELASRYVTESLVAVTGTNGKTTTTAVVGEMLRHSGKKVFVGGNIGSPLIEHAVHGGSADAVVVEVSSFQLDTIETFRPRVGVLLNITPDHLDRYPDLAAYGRAKARLFENQRGSDTAVLNGADSFIRRLTAGIPSRRLFFTGRSEAESGAAVFSDHIFINGVRSQNQKEIPALEATFDLAGTCFVGRYGRENAAAACVAALAAGADPSGIQGALKAFKGLPHRLESVGESKGIRFVNDSKATNVYSVLCALESFTSPVVLVMGGRDKGSDFTLLREPVRRYARKVILMGEAAPQIQAALEGTVPMETAKDMVSAVDAAFRAAFSGDVVLLSPACASFDMFTDYTHRGKTFRKAVEALS